MARISKERIGEYLQTAFRIIKENGGQMKIGDLIPLVEKRLTLSDYEKERTETGAVRWETSMRFESTNCVILGWLTKKKGIWYITPEGEKALALSPAEFVNKCRMAYRKSRLEKTEKEKVIAGPTELPEDTENHYGQAFEQATELAHDEIRKYILSKNPYEFQDMIAALLRAMGYHTPFIAPRGRDGGVDIIAYQDPFGTMIPRIKVQVKHREQKVTVQEIRQLLGLLQKEGDAGLFVSSGGFTDEAIQAMRSAHLHMEAMDLERFIDLWEQYYDKMNEEDKALLPLRKIYFLAPE